MTRRKWLMVCLKNPWIWQECQNIYMGYNAKKKLQFQLLLTMFGMLSIGILLNLLTFVMGLWLLDWRMVYQEGMSLMVVMGIFYAFYLGRHTSFVQLSGWMLVEWWWTYVKTMYVQSQKNTTTIMSWDTLSLRDIYTVSQLSTDEISSWVYRLLTPKHQGHREVWLEAGCIDIQNLTDVQDAISRKKKGYHIYDEVEIF